MAAMAQKSVTLHNAHTPVRPAPPPPDSTAGQRLSSILPKPSDSQSKLAPKLSIQPGFLKFGMNKKKTAPPPRPPPPKIQTKPMHQSASFNDLLLSKQQSAPTVDLLLDWNSPPTSPTPGRSSSDGISLQSFGSDSSGGTFPPAGALSRSESGFESEPDLWADVAPSIQATAVVAAKAFAMPTIIRPNRNKTAAPVQRTSSQPATTTTSNWPDLVRVQAMPLPAPSTTPPKPDNLLMDSEMSLPYDYSPPEPSIPPPAPPSLFMSTPTKFCREPHAMALYDYQSQHSGDLSFTEGDQITLMRRVNSEWLYGRCGSSEGMFPADFVRVVVDLDEETVEEAVGAESAPQGVAHNAFPGYQAVALYAFQAETNEDLSLQEGDVVQVTADLNNGWLVGYHRSGRVGCRQGQFPQSFVQRI